MQPRPLKHFEIQGHLYAGYELKHAQILHGLMTPEQRNRMPKASGSGAKAPLSAESIFALRKAQVHAAVARSDGNQSTVGAAPVAKSTFASRAAQVEAMRTGGVR